MALVGYWGNTFYTLGWGILYGIIISVIIWLISSLYITATVGTDGTGDLNDMGNMMFFALFILPILYGVGFIFHLKYTARHSLGYGFTNAQEIYGIPKDQQVCTPEKCDWGAFVNYPEKMSSPPAYLAPSTQ